MALPLRNLVSSRKAQTSSGECNSQTTGQTRSAFFYRNVTTLRSVYVCIVRVQSSINIQT